MSIYYQDDRVTLHHGDAIEVLASFPEASVDAVVCDPPYGLEFMGKGWDAPWRGDVSDVNADAGFHGGGVSATRRAPSFTGSTNPKCLVCKGTRRGRRDGTAKVAVCLCADGGKFPNVRATEMRAFGEWCELWVTECLRVLKPGGHLLAFGGTRTWHRLAVAVEDAGFEIRDNLAWLYGSGFPKSMDVSKAIDRSTGENRARQLEFTEWMRSTGITADAIREATGTHMASHYLTTGSQPSIATADLFDKLRPHLPDVPERIERLVAERTGIEWTDYVKRPVLSQSPAYGIGGSGVYRGHADGAVASITASHSDAAREWEGWGTALKPGHEPIVMARKPLTGTVAANVLEHGTGALNIDACRIDMGAEYDPNAVQRQSSSSAGMGGLGESGYKANHEQAKFNAKGRWPANVILDESQSEVLEEQSGASRFFYVAKAPKSERPVVDGVAHPTVKPVSLMSWLVRLVTPPGGTVLEPFAGSGTTVEAAMREGFNVVAVEREADYLPLIMARISREHARQAAEDANHVPTLFDEEMGE